MPAIRYSLLILTGLVLAGCHATGFSEPGANTRGGFEFGMEKSDGYVPLPSTSSGASGGG